MAAELAEAMEPDLGASWVPNWAWQLGFYWGGSSVEARVSGWGSGWGPCLG